MAAGGPRYCVRRRRVRLHRRTRHLAAAAGVDQPHHELSARSADQNPDHVAARRFGHMHWMQCRHCNYWTSDMQAAGDPGCALV